MTTAAAASSPVRRARTALAATPRLTLALVALCGASSLSCSRRPPGPATPDAESATRRALPPPPRPADVLLEAHFGQPRATTHALSALLHQAVPLDLGLALALGVDSTVLAASDLSRPLDVVAAGDPRNPDLLWVFSPADRNAFRSTLSARYRFTHVAELGERLEPRENAGAPAGRRRAEQLACAVIGVPPGDGGTVPARLVCTRRPEALEHAARWAAYVAHGRATDTGDARIEVEGDALRAHVVPAVQRTVDDAARELARSAEQARREHPRPPDFGDPEAVVALVSELSRDLGPAVADVRRLVVRATVSPRDVALEADLALDPAGRSTLARDAVARLGAPLSHPLAARLPPDDPFALGSRLPAPERVATLQGGADTLLRVLGPRVPDAEAARADLHALVAQVGDAFALSTGADAQGGVAATALFSLTDGGAGARAVLARLPRAAWLRGVRLGGAPVLARATPGAGGASSVLLRLGPVPASAPRPPAPPPAVAGVPTPAPPRQLALAVAGDTLVVLAAARPAEALTALSARVAGGPVPAPLAAAGEAPLAGGVRVRPPAGEPQDIPFTYRATRDGADVTGRGRLALPGLALGTLGALLREFSAQP